MKIHKKKRCTKCKKYKSKDKFYKNKTIKGGHSWWCKVCDGKAKTPEHKANGRLRARSGMTLEQYYQMLANQNGGCAICLADKPGYGRRLFCVDHDHITGKTRGLLCYPCNLGLGHFKDTPVLLESAINYLRSHKINEQSQDSIHLPLQ